MKRGQVWTVAGGPDYAGKPRPVVILQSDKFDATASVTICGLTSTGEVAIPRPEILPTPANGVRVVSRAMVDKIATVPRQRLGRAIGRLTDEEMTRLDRAIVIFLGLAG